MTTIQTNHGTMYTDKKLSLIPEPEPLTRDEYDIMKLRRVLHECEHDRDSGLTAQLDAVEAMMNVLPADRDNADILRAAQDAGFPRATMLPACDVASRGEGAGRHERQPEGVADRRWVFVGRKILGEQP